MSAIAELHCDFILYITPEKFYIEALSGGKELLVIDRVSQEISLQVNHSQIPQASSTKPICGIVGTLQLLAGPYLVIITKKHKVGTINGQTIWQVAETDVISYKRTLLHLTQKQISQNELYISMVENVLNTPFLYFSYSYDITHTLQRLHNTTPEFLQMPYHERADLRFVWNGHLLREFANQPELCRFCLPLLHGFISINQCSLNGKPFLWTIVSRRCCFRAGTRLFTRGIDVQGNVANFVETEQIVEFSGDRSSFVQVDHHGAEGILEKSYGEMVNQMGNSNIRYESFDFHAECRHLRWDRLSILIDRLAHEQDEFGCFLLTRDGTLVSLQDGVFRTNCIDCLDRTNVVQSMLARRSLTQVMQKLGILRAGQRVEDQPYFEPLFKSVWADNADVISIQYSGTGALKTDFTRTGKRTVWGLISDGMNSFTRYCKNNFADGFRQDSIDLVLGRYMVEDGEGITRPCPLDVEKGWKYITFPWILVMAIFMFFANVVTPSEYTTESLLYLLFWASMVAVTVATIMIYGTEFVDYPKLCEIRKTFATIE
ncbi:Phosphatidylinositide phosphatase SAC1-A [Cryptotermes secundus]|uniref:Phosphatidylinositol-3-phosphatase SAC1 n=1 Tax=Cryptotermes secundus TaxID=105785 RepID=A0A2J7QJM6_9NEOP|nr:phosphatidylinositide phosphatase SAC1-B isoform X2 [Cryptotermes secundus]PNF28790.1 Phosphatidylinositide phosphatase SAC1-A [Cryptotermes secundus]